MRDGHTLLLTDGRGLRLAAIEVTDQSRAALQALAAGRELRLAKLGADHDRYGRLVAFAFAGEAQLSVQEMLVEDGQARVSARVGDKACADALLAAEPRLAPPGAGCGPIPILPLWRRKIGVACRASGSFCAGGRQGLVGARQRRHYM